MNGSLMNHIQEFIMEAYRSLREQDATKARGFLAHMQYLTKLDGMGTQE